MPDFPLTEQLRAYLKRHAPSSPPPGRPHFRDLGPVIKSPLDSKRYKVIKLDNGLRATLVSTCVHETARNTVNVASGSKFDGAGNPSISSAPARPLWATLQEEVNEFNKKHLNIRDYNDFGETNPEISKSSSKGEGRKPESDSRHGSNHLSENTSSESSGKVPKLLKCCKGPATICITVGVGAFLDPEDRQGLAHFVEHLIFLGSKNHREPNKLFNKVYENGGAVNATTYAEHTDFYFSCASTAFEECVDILVDGLKQPLFLSSAIKREINAIDSEYAIKSTSDATRLDDFLRFRAGKHHPISRFYWGNRRTLNHDDIEARAKRWKNQYYTSDNMTVCIQAPMPMAQLETFVWKHFADIPRSPPGTPSPSELLLRFGEPFSNTEFRVAYAIAPVSHFTCLVISWKLPAKYWKNYETKPLEYIRLMLQNTAPGGLREYMRQKLWITEWGNLSTNCCPLDDNYCQNEYCSIFSITIHVTDHGYSQQREVIKAVFSYLKMLFLGGVKSRYFEEMKRSAATRFHYRNWDDLLQSGSNIAECMRHVPAPHILTSQTLFTEWDPTAIRDSLSLMTPRYANYLMVSPENWKECDKSTAPRGIWFNRLPDLEEMYLTLDNVNVYTEFRLPPYGTFLVKEVCMEAKANIPTMGTIITTDKLVVTYKNQKKSPCVTPLMPTARYTVSFSSHMVSNHASRLKQGVLEFWTTLLSDGVIGKTGHKYDHLFHYQVDVNNDGISLFLSGPRCHLVDLLHIVVKQVFGCNGCRSAAQVSGEIGHVPSIAKNLQADLIRAYSNETFDVESLSRDIVFYLLEANHASLFEIRKHIQDVGLESGEFHKLITKFRERMRVNVILEGHVTSEDLNRIRRLLTGKSDELIYYKPPTILPEIVDRATFLPYGTSLLYVKALHPSYVISVVTNFYQVNFWDTADARGHVAMLQRLLKRPIANQLRTREQLGYSVQVTVQSDETVVGVTVRVLTQPNRHPTHFVDSRIDTFLQNYYWKVLKHPTKKKVVQSLLNLDNNDLEQLQSFYQDNLLKNGKYFRKLSIQVEGYRPGTKLSSEKYDELFRPGEGAVRTTPGDRDEDIANSYSDEMESQNSMIQLQYLPLKGKHKEDLKKEGGTQIVNVALFKRRMPVLAAAD